MAVHPSTSAPASTSPTPSGDAGSTRPVRRATTGPSKAALRWRSVMHKDDEHLLRAGMDKRLVEALRVRREEHFHHVDGPVDSGRMSVRDRCAYAAPSLGTVPLTLLISVYGIQFYEVVVGADLLLIAMFLALARSLDVVTDPTMSYWTDSLRTKYGRRRPFLAIGCIPYGMCLVGLLTPPRSLSSTAVSVWFGMFYITFFLCTTFCNIPYDAMGPELTDNPEDRSRLFFLCTIFDGLGSLLAVMLPVILTSTIGSVRETDLSSCSNPVDGAITLSSCSTSLSASRAARIWPMQETVSIYGYTQDTCEAARIVANASFSGAESLQSYCVCKDMCETANGDDTSRGAYFLTALIFALWYSGTMLNCVRLIKERSMLPGSNLPKPAPLVASSLRTFNNRPFNILLPAWICDALVNSLISSLLTYFVRYIVEPEFAHVRCNSGLGNDLDWDCKSETVLGMSVLALLLTAFIFSPFWLQMTKWIGKRNTWLLWSLTMACTNPLYFLVGVGDAQLCIIISGLNGIPFGAKFLADAILADVIDYDEFLTGNRAEATYTMFKSFLPKVAAIPASAIPVALLDVFGHIAPVDGIIQQQTAPALKTYIRVTIIVLPTTLALIAFCLKLRFPIRTRSQNLVISEGIGRHMVGTSALCPISNMDYSLVQPDEDEVEHFNRLDNFPGVTPLTHLLEGGAGKLIMKTRLQFVFSVLFSFSSMMCVVQTWSLLQTEGWCWDKAGVQVTSLASESTCVSAAGNVWKESACRDSTGALLFAGDMPACKVQAGSWSDAPTNLSFLPVLFLVLFGVSITMIGLAAGRLATARHLRDNPPTENLLRKIKSIRIERNKTKQFKASPVDGFIDLLRQLQSPFAGTQIQQEAKDKVRNTMSQRVVTSDEDKKAQAAEAFRHAGEAADGGEELQVETAEPEPEASSAPGMIAEDSAEGTPDAQSPETGGDSPAAAASPVRARLACLCLW
jgi:GPH family glycoside/pentoside/hexuronide:cation symporter